MAPPEINPQHHSHRNLLFAPNTLLRMHASADIYRRTIERHGNVVLVEGLIDTLLVADPDLAGFVLKNGEKFPRASLQMKMEPTVGKILTEDGQDYAERRQLITEPLKRSAIETYVSIIQEETAAGLSTWREKQAQGRFDLKHEVYAIMERIVPRTLVGGAKLPEGLGEELAQMISQGVDMKTQILPHKNLAYKRKRKEVTRKIDNFIKESQEKGQDLGILSEFLRKLPREEAIKEFFGVYSAALDTTGNTIVLTLLELAQAPAAYAQLRQEAHARFTAKEPPTRQNLQWAHLCFLEGARKYPSSWRALRQAAEDVDYNGMTIPKGTWVMSLTYLMQRDKNTWGEDADVFNPARMAEIPEDAYFYPWQIGIHACPGKPLSEIEGMIIISMIANEFETIALPENYVIEPHYSATIEPPADIPMMFS